jgi:hypothetical protein
LKNTPPPEIDQLFIQTKIINHPDDDDDDDDDKNFI